VRDRPELVVFNKADLEDDSERLALRGLEPDALFVSARTGEGIGDLLERVAALLPRPDIRVELLVPYDRGEVVSSLHEHGKVLSTSYEGGGTRVSALVTAELAGAVQAFEVIAS
jgi:GTP-binding protein HflX